MKYGFVIDDRKCIGCHACSVACKIENNVPLGVYRTWVKYVEKGRFPEVRRFFQVTRCNHCENPPCVAICPVGAMFQRTDGIVDFDARRCIGCKSCMQACPYEAIYMDPETNTAAKCHYCAHRTAMGREPACVAVCPERAIVAGDLDDRSSEIAQTIARHDVRVRKPEENTKPKVFYIRAEDATMVPEAARRENGYMWAQHNPAIEGPARAKAAQDSIVPTTTRVTYDVAHEQAWGWQVPFFLWTKVISTGALMVPALAITAGWFASSARLSLSLSFFALAFMAVTVGLLIVDLARPERFLSVVLKPQTKSWLFRGSILLIAYSGLCGLYWLTAVLGAAGASRALLWPTVVAGILASLYTAFLLGQCVGCGLWRTPALPIHLIVQGILASASLLVLLPPICGRSPEVISVARGALAVGLALNALILCAEFGTPHSSPSARIGARMMTTGPWSRLFWLGAVVVGMLIPALLLFAGRANGMLTALAGVLVLLGMLAYEWCFVMAGQSVPRS